MQASSRLAAQQALAIAVAAGAPVAAETEFDTTEAATALHVLCEDTTAGAVGPTSAIVR